MSNTSGPFALASALLLAAHSGHGGSPAGAQAAVDPLAQRGAELLAPFKSDLQMALRSGLAEGPQAAVAACQTQAPAIAERLGNEQVRLGRSSHRLRNPANAPRPWMQDVLDAYLAAPAAAAPRVVALKDNRVGYAEPIKMQPMCLICHGSSIEPELASLLAERYPDDAATGFEVGDLRGIFWAEYPAELPAVD